MNVLLNLLKVFNLNLSPSNSALSALLGLSLGVLPLISPIAWIILVLGLVIRLNAAYLALFWLLGEVVAIGLNQPINALGESLLGSLLLEGLWQEWYNQTLWRFFHFNHTYVMGGSVALLVLALPLWLLLFFIIRQYQKTMFSEKMKGFISLPVVRSLFKVNKDGEGKSLGLFRQWINIQGSILVLVVICVWAVGAYIIQTAYVKDYAQQEISKQWGADVEVDNVSFSLSPIGFSINGLKLAGLKDADKEALFVKNITAHVNLYHLVVGRLVIDKMELSRIQIDSSQFEAKENTTDKKTEEGGIESLSLDQFSVPTAEDLFGSNQFKTFKERERLQQATNQAFKNAEQLRKTVPSEQRYQQYQREIDKLRAQKIDIKSVQSLFQQVKQIKTSISKDIDQFNQAHKALKEEIDSVSVIMRGLPKASEEDRKRINQQIQLNVANTENLTRLLLGEEVDQWVKNGQIAYQYAAPYIAWFQQQENKKPDFDVFGSGRYIEFKEDHIQPDFNIRYFIAEAGNESWRVEMKNINFDHVVSQLATTGQLTLMDKNKEDKEIKITIDHRSSSNVVNQLDFDSGKISISNKVIIDNQSISMVILQAQEQQKIKINIKGEGRLSGFWQQDYSGINWDNEKMKQSKGNAMRPGLFNKIVDFRNRVTIGGVVDSPDVDISSNLDDRLFGVFRDAMQQTQERTKQEARDKLDKEISSALGEGRSSIVSLTQQRKGIEGAKKKWQKKLDEEVDRYQQEIKSQLASQTHNDVEKKKRELKNKAEEKANELKKELIKWFK